MKVDPQKVEQRKLARKEATELIGMLQSYSIGTPEYEEAFWEEFYKAFPERLAKPVPQMGPKPLTEQEAIAFEEEIVPRGQYERARVYSVPMNYWYWWIEHKDPFTQKLQRYLLSDRAQKRTREEE